MSKSDLLLCCVLACSGLAGCQLHTAPVRERSPVPLNAAWSTAAPVADLGPWLEEFGDTALETLALEAVDTNFNLQAARSRVAAARAQARISGAARLPQVDAGAVANRSKRGLGGNFGSRTTDTFNLQGEISWEADLWGRIADRTQAALADAEAAEADFRVARLSLVANVTREYFNALEGYQQRELAQRTVDNFQRSLAIIEEQYRRGLGSALDVRLARNNLANAESIFQQQERLRRGRVRALEVLLGRYPEGALEPREPLPEIEAPVPVGLPSELLQRRPDIVAAERRLTAAEYRRDDAQRNLLPSITLTGSGGTASDELAGLLDANFSIWSLASGLVQPLFQGGRLEAERDQAAAQEDEALYDYAQTVLTALGEVETALDAESFLVEQQAALAVSAQEAAAAETLALDQYRRGLADIITLLESQRRSFDAQSSLLSVVNQRLQNRVNLYLALGGNFSARAAATEVP